MFDQRRRLRRHALVVERQIQDSIASRYATEVFVASVSGFNSQIGAFKPLWRGTFDVASTVRASGLQSVTARVGVGMPMSISFTCRRASPSPTDVNRDRSHRRVAAGSGGGERHDDAHACMHHGKLRARSRRNSSEARQPLVALLVATAAAAVKCLPHLECAGSHRRCLIPRAHQPCIDFFFFSCAVTDAEIYSE